jgi:hypothetical protein
MTYCGTSWCANIVLIVIRVCVCESTVKWITIIIFMIGSASKQLLFIEILFTNTDHHTIVLLSIGIIVQKLYNPQPYNCFHFTHTQLVHNVKTREQNISNEIVTSSSTTRFRSIGNTTIAPNARAISTHTKVCPVS